MRQFYPILFFLLLVGGCQITADVDDIVYRPSYLGPLVFSRLEPIEIAETADKSADYDLNPIELGIPGFAFNTPVAVPPLGPLNFPPEYTELNDFFAEISVNEVVFTITFTNNLPLTINENTEVVGRDSATGNIMFRHIIPRSIAPGETYEGIQQENNKILTSDLALTIENFTTPGTSSATFQNVDFVVNVDLNVLDLDIVKVRPNRTFTIDNTSDFAFDLSENDMDTDPSGTLSLFITNYLPTTIDLTLELWDDQGNTVFSLFGPTPINLPGPPVAVDGSVQNPIEYDLIDFISVDTLDSFGDATQLHADVSFTTPNHPVLLLVQDENFFRIQLTADLEATLIANP